MTNALWRSSLRRLQEEFQSLVSAGGNPTTVLLHSRSDCWNASPAPSHQVDDGTDPKRRMELLGVSPLDYIRYRELVWNQPFYYRDWGYELAPKDMNGTEKPRLYGLHGSGGQESPFWSMTLGWSIEPSEDDLGSSRHWYTYGQAPFFQQLDQIAERAGRVVRSERIFSAFRDDPNWASPGDMLPTLPPINSLRASFEGYWRDIVCHFAMRNLPALPVRFMVQIFGDGDQPGDRDHWLDRLPQPGDWFGRDRPTYMVLTIPEFCTASIHVIDALIEGWEPTPSILVAEQPPVDFWTIQSFVLEWLAERYQKGRMELDGSSLHTLMSDKTDFRRVPKTPADAKSLSELSGRFVAVLNFLVEADYLRVVKNDGPANPNFMMRFRVTAKVLNDRTAIPAVAKSDPAVRLPSAENNESDGLNRALDSLTPLQKRITTFLWDRVYATSFDTLAENCWSDKNASDDTIVKRLKDIEKKWSDCAKSDRWFDCLDLEISTASRAAKLIRSGQNGGQK